MRAMLAGAALLSAPALAQTMAGMPGMAMPAPAKATAKAPTATRAEKHEAMPAHANDQAAMPGMTMPASAVPSVAPAGTALPTGDAPAPPAPREYYADAAFGSDAMARARARMAHEQGGQPFHQILFNLAEIQAGHGRDGYRWDGEAWFGGDIDRLALRTEGIGTRHAGVDEAEIQALYARAIGPYFALQAGIRQDVRPTPARTYASVGVEGLAPYMFEVEARLFVSTRGEVLARLETWYDERVTQRLILQPRVELNLAARTARSIGVGRGLIDAELGVRLRYEIARRFAPYVGVSYRAETGRTAALARAGGRNPSTTSAVAGVRAWF